MAYTPISSSQTNPGAPLNATLMKALAENPESIALGEPGATSILEGIANLTTYDGIGTYVFAFFSSATDLASNGTTAGSNLRACSAVRFLDLAAVSTSGDSTTFESASFATLTGTWRCMGYQDYSFAVTTPSGGGSVSVTGNAFGATLWMRIA